MREDSEFKTYNDLEAIAAERKVTPEKNIKYDTAANYKFNLYGPKIGEVAVEKTNFAIRASRDPGYEGAIRLSFCAPSQQSEEKESVEGFVILRTLNSMSATENPNNPKLQYGNQTEKFMPKVYIENMVSGSTKSEIDSNRKSHNASQYKGLGKMLHRAAVEWSFLQGCDGRVQLEVHGDSFGFHENFGFRGQDINNPDGSLHHLGQEPHQRIAIDRYDAAKQYKQEQDFWKSEGVSLEEYVRLYGEKKNYVSSTDEQVYMYLPDEVIKREKDRMSAGQAEIFVDAGAVEDLLNEQDLLLQIEKTKSLKKKWGTGNTKENVEARIYYLKELIKLCG